MKELLEQIGKDVSATRDTLTTLATEVLELKQRVEGVEKQQRRVDSMAPRALRAVSESIHEHDTEMAAVAVHMGEQARVLNELRATSDAHAAELSKLAKKHAVRLAVFVPLAVKLLDLLMMWRHP